MPEILSIEKEIDSIAVETLLCLNGVFESKAQRMFILKNIWGNVIHTFLGQRIIFPQEEFEKKVKLLEDPLLKHAEFTEKIEPGWKSHLYLNLKDERIEIDRDFIPSVSFDQTIYPITFFSLIKIVSSI